MDPASRSLHQERKIMSAVASGTESATESALSALDNRPMSPLQRRAALLVSMGEFISGYDLLVMGAALIYLRPQFDLSPYATGLLGASTFLGAMVGLLIFGDLSDRLGRRAIFVANLVFFVLFSIVSAFITDATQLFIARFLVGMGVGMDIPTSTAYLAEIAPRKQRGAILGSLPQIMWILGAMLSTFIALPLGYFFGDQAWRWMFGLAALPALLVLIGRRLLPESPRWLLAKGRLEEARDALTRFGVPVEESLQANREQGNYGELFYPPLSSRTFWVSTVFFLNCLSAPIATIATPFVLRYIGLMSVTQTLIFSGLVWVTALIGASCSFFLIDRIGRRKLCYISLIPAGICALCIGLFATDKPNLLLVLFFLFSFFNWLGAPPLQWVWSSELFPTRLRGRSQGFCNAVCRLAISINIFLVPVAQATIGFGVLVGLLSIPLFLYAFIVSRVAIFDSTNLSIEDLARGVRPAAAG
jgi:putative MFS transporter